MAARRLTITGKVSEYCLLVVRKHARDLKPSDELVIECDHPAAATTFIPKMARELGLSAEKKKIGKDSWEIRLRRN